MARLTKIELEQRLDAALKDAAELRLRLAVADGNVTAYRNRCEQLEAAQNAAPCAVDAAQLSTYRQALAKAREAAMRTGKCVRVGA